MLGSVLRQLLAGAVLAGLAGYAQAAAAKSNKGPAPPSPSTAGAAYIAQIGAPADWRTNATYWRTAPSLTPSNLRADKTNIRSGSIIDGRGNRLRQDGSGSGHARFALQWGDANTGLQQQSGTGHRAELVQISPGARLGPKANSGAGNGGEFDVFGFEVDPGNSGARNRSPEVGGMVDDWTAVGNTGAQTQSGVGNAARLVQIGWENTAVERQHGEAMQVSVVQLGIGNTAETTQFGRGHELSIVQLGLSNVALVTQSGNMGDVSTIAQHGESNTSRVDQ